MTTKLVYTLTCARDKHYIEQCLMAVFSARHYNPDATIVLIVDDKTDALFVGKRAELLNYITKKIVVPFEDKGLSPMYRSRWIKTSVRQLVDGDILFVDCDTICQNSLAEIDNFYCEFAMVPDEHLPIASYNKDLVDELQERAKEFNYDIQKEDYYFNSGVIFAKDTPRVRDFWERWHENWQYGEERGVKIDQPSLSKTDSEFDHIIDQLPDVWNTLVYMNPSFIAEGKILHFWQFRNRSFVFGEPFLAYVAAHGIDEYVKQCILNPTDSVLPSINVFYHGSMKTRLGCVSKIRNALKNYANHIDNTFVSHPWINKFTTIERRFLEYRLFFLTALCFVVRLFLSLIGKGDNKKSEVFFS